MQKKDWLVTELLCVFLGTLGVHRFYTGYIGVGILQLLTMGGCGIWTLIDIIFISLGKYKDANGFELEGYNRKAGLIVFAIFLFLFAVGAIIGSLINVLTLIS